MKHRILVLAFIVTCFTAIPAQARYLQMQQRYGYVQNRPPVISPTATIQHVGVRPVNATVTPRQTLQSVAQFKSQPPQLQQYADGVNLYQYCGSDPINYVDPWGLAACSYSVGLCKRNVMGISPPKYVWVPISGVLVKVKIPEPIRNAANKAVPDHHDVRLKTYQSKNCTGAALSTNTKGFFADSFTGAAKEYVLSLMWLSSGWVSGHTDSSSATKCSMTCVSKKRYDQVKKRFDNFNPTSYHLTKFNCQHWASWVLK